MLFYEKFLLAKHDRVILRERLSHWNEYFIYCSRKLSSIQPFTWIPINDHQLLTTQNHIHSFRLFRSISICMRVCVSVCHCMSVRSVNAYKLIEICSLTHWLRLQFVSFILFFWLRLLSIFILFSSDFVIFFFFWFTIYFCIFFDFNKINFI